MKPEHQLPTGQTLLQQFNLIVGIAKFPFEEATRQAIENIIDAHGKRALIYAQPAEHFRVVDDGEGISREKSDGLNRLFVRNKQIHEETIGKNNSGRLLFLRPAGEIVYRFSSKNYPDVMKHNFTRRDLRYLMSQCTDENQEPSLAREPIVDNDIPEWCYDKDGNCLLGNGKTGTALELVEIDWSRFPGVQEFRRKLRDILSVWSAEMTYVNDELIPQRPVEDKYQGSIPIDQQKFFKLGRVCDFYFYRCKRPTSADYIYLGKNPLCSIEEFLRPIRQNLLASEIPDFMRTNKHVSGFIHIPIANEYASHDRNSLDSKFYDDPERVEQAVYFLADVVAKKLLERYPDLNRIESPAEVAPQGAIQILHSMFPSGSLGGVVEIGVDPGRPSKNREKLRQDIIIVPSKPKLAVGVEQIIKVIVGKRGGRWNAKKSGGTIDVETGPHVCYTAGNKPGKFSLEYTCNKGKKIIPIEIEAESPFQLSRGRIDLYPGGDPVNVVVRNYDREDVKFEIVHQETRKPAMHFNCKTLGRAVDISANHDCPLGYYRFIASTPSGERAEGAIEVLPYPGNLSKIDTGWYDFKKAVRRDSPIVEDIVLLHDRAPDGVGSVSRMYINEENELLKEIERDHGKRELYYYKLQSDVVYAHYKLIGSDDPSRDSSEYMLKAMREAKLKKRRERGH